ncbi:hypothetical protein ACFQ9X_32130 [Catenulispora yoronensis]
MLDQPAGQRRGVTTGSTSTTRCVSQSVSTVLYRCTPGGEVVDPQHSGRQPFRVRQRLDQPNQRHPPDRDSGCRSQTSPGPPDQRQTDPLTQRSTRSYAQSVCLETHSDLTVDLDRATGALTIKIRTSRVHTQPDFIISSAITTLDETATPTLWHEFPDKEVTNQELGLEYILSFDAPRLPDVDFEVGAWLSYYGLAPHTGFEPVRLRSKAG